MDGEVTVTVKVDRAQVLECLPRCETCRYWQQYVKPSTLETVPMGLCEAFPVKLDDGKLPDPIFISAAWHAATRTAPDFGCVLHEPKEGES